MNFWNYKMPINKIEVIGPLITINGWILTLLGTCLTKNYNDFFKISNYMKILSYGHLFGDKN